MLGTALIYQPKTKIPEETKFAVIPHPGFLKKAVGEYLEQVPGFTTINRPANGLIDCIAYRNKYAKSYGAPMPINDEATVLWSRALERLSDSEGERYYPTGLRGEDGHLTDYLCGTVIVLTGDSEFIYSVTGCF